MTAQEKTKSSFLWSFVVANTRTGMQLLAAQLAFKVSMIHRHLQFTLRIAVRCVLLRCWSQDIHR